MINKALKLSAFIILLLFICYCRFQLKQLFLYRICTTKQKLQIYNIFYTYIVYDWDILGRIRT